MSIGVSSDVGGAPAIGLAPASVTTPGATAKKAAALSKLSTGATRARKALDAHRKDEPATAFYYLGLLFGGRFPSR